jgi:Ino eighty subunit 2
MSLNDADDSNADAKTAAVVPGMLRFVSSIRSGKFEMFVSAPPGKEQAIALEATRPEPVIRSNTKAHCGVKGCGETRKYRSVLDFEKGGCSMSHLKLVEQSLRGV